MEEYKRVFAVIFLVLCTYYDCKNHKIPALLLYCAFLAATVWTSISVILGLYGYPMGWVIGCAMLILSVLTKEALGKGDGWVFLVLGVLLTFQECMKILFIALFAAAAFSAVALILKKASRKTPIAFLPFILAASLI